MKELGRVSDIGHPERETAADELLAIRCQLGEPDAFDELIRRWHGPLWKYVRRLVGDEEAAEETLQDAWLRVLRGIGRLRDASRLRAWLFGIARRAVMDRLRERYATPPTDPVDEMELAGPDDPRQVDDLETDLARLHEELQRLPIVEREVLTLFYLQELTLGEVADVLDVPVGTVKSRLFRARRLLRHEMDARGVRS